MALELIKNVFKKAPSVPLANWIFKVYFYYTDGAGTQNQFEYELNNPTDYSSIPIKVDLPKFETRIVTLKYFGSEKSYPVLRKHGGETTLEFYAFSNRKDNAFILHNFLKDYTKANLNGAGLFYHKEFLCAFNQIDVEVYNRTDNHIYTYRLKNCIVTNFDEGNMSYESSELIKFNLSVHYDDWCVVQYEDDETSTNFGMIGTN